ncbi:MAG TPA: DUF4351 domain-containing protein [Pirellulaceae bacterium]|nr:DUF4351 domain-containing protein [Pirellulaceae bacterium]
MPKDFDATTRHLLEVDPRAWLEYVGVPTTAPIEIINSDLSTITTEADKVIRIADADPWLVHLELQSTYEQPLALRLARYNLLLEYRHRMPVLSVAVLLRQEADGRGLAGLLQATLPNGFCHYDFRYRVVRVWEQPVQQILAGGVATLPLAPLAAVSLNELPAVIRQIDERLTSEASVAEADAIWASTYILMGLRYPAEFAKQLLQQVRAMTESTTYQAILEEEAKRILMRQGHKRFGSPTPQIMAQIEAITDVDRIEQLAERLLDVNSWEELLVDSR